MKCAPFSRFPLSREWLGPALRAIASRESCRRFTFSGGSNAEMAVQHLGAVAHRLAVERFDDMAVVDDIDAVRESHGGRNVLLDHHAGRNSRSRSAGWRPRKRPSMPNTSSMSAGAPRSSGSLTPVPFGVRPREAATLSRCQQQLDAGTAEEHRERALDGAAGAAVKPHHGRRRERHRIKIMDRERQAARADDDRADHP